VEIYETANTINEIGCVFKAGPYVKKGYLLWKNFCNRKSTGPTHTKPVEKGDNLFESRILISAKYSENPVR